MDSTCNYKLLLVSLRLLSGQIKTDSYPQNFLSDSDSYYQDLQIVNRLVCRILGFLDAMCNYEKNLTLKNHIFFAKSAWNSDSLAGAEYLLALYEGGVLKCLNPHYFQPNKPIKVQKKPVTKSKEIFNKHHNLN
jgi:hypothetical protein